MISACIVLYVMYIAREVDAEHSSPGPHLKAFLEGHAWMYIRHIA